MKIIPEILAGFGDFSYLCHVKKLVSVQILPIHDRLFLYSQNSVENIAAPCRVYGNVPGSSETKALTTRSAVFYVKN